VEHSFVDVRREGVEVIDRAAPDVKNAIYKRGRLAWEQLFEMARFSIATHHLSNGLKPNDLPSQFQVSSYPGTSIVDT
jgi:hypothetical protein